MNKDSAMRGAIIIASVKRDIITIEMMKRTNWRIIKSV